MVLQAESEVAAILINLPLALIGVLAVRKIGSGKAVHISITDFELPGQDFLLHTGHHLFHDLYATHEFFRTGNVGFADIVPLCDLLTNACF